MQISFSCYIFDTNLICLALRYEIRKDICKPLHSTDISVCISELDGLMKKLIMLQTNRDKF